MIDRFLLPGGQEETRPLDPLDSPAVRRLSADERSREKKRQEEGRQEGGGARLVDQVSFRVCAVMSKGELQGMRACVRVCACVQCRPGWVGGRQAGAASRFRGFRVQDLGLAASSGCGKCCGAIQAALSRPGGIEHPLADGPMRP